MNPLRPWLFRFTLAGIGLFLAAATASAVNTSVVPAPKNAPGWMDRHREFVKEAHRGGIDLLFLGDSITDYWRTEVGGGYPRGKKVWDEYFAPLHAANFGISGDRTQDLLWRLQNGELDGISPKVVVLMIGTNNTPEDKDTHRLRNQPPEVVAGVTAVVEEIRRRLPHSQILLLAIFPRGQKGDAIRGRIAWINQRIAKLDDGRHVHYLDIGPKFLEPDGTLSLKIMPDLLHPTEEGYVIWAKAIQKPVAELMGR